MFLLPESSKRYAAIMIDPPWQFKVWSKDTGHGRSAESYYPTLDIEQMKRLPIQRFMADDCAVFMWATWAMLPEALSLGIAWGLEYKTLAFDWLKLTKNGKWHMGMGYWTRANSEPCLLFTRGKPKRKDRGVRQLIAEDRQMPLFEPLIAHTLAHSTKPDEAYNRVERLVDGHYLDVFARRKRKGWDAIGNEIDGRDIRDVLRAWQWAA
jgi:site-specific DNA-methyltransferase (adenine-specific)